MTNYDMILKDLYTYTEDELFYKDMYLSRMRPEKLHDFFSHLDKTDINHRKLLVPEFLKQIIPEIIDTQTLKETDVFYKKQLYDVLLYKHNRYAPVPPHKHNYFEMFYVVFGNCRHTIDGNCIELTKGDICFISPNSIHTLSVFDDSIVMDIIIRSSSFDHIFFNFLRNKNALTHFFWRNLYDQNKCSHIIIHTQEDLSVQNQVLEMYAEQIQDDIYTNHIIYSMMCIFFTKLIRKYEKTIEFPAVSDFNSSKAVPMLSYIEDHYNEVSLELLSKKFHYSPTYCSKLIRQYTGKTFSELIRDYKMRHAESLLINTNIKIANISAILGYENPESFIRLFKKKYQQTPSAFRNQNMDLSHM